MTFALILAEVGQVAAKDISMSGGMNMVDGTFVTALLMGVAAVITAIGMLLWGKNYMSKREDEIRTQIANELRAKIVNDPMHIEQSNYQATMKANAADHADIFARLRFLESELAGVKATMVAKFDGLSAYMMETREMVRSLYDKVCNGGKRK